MYVIMFQSPNFKVENVTIIDVLPSSLLDPN
jgi:hypothetical protein